MDFSNMEVTIDHIADAGAKIKAYATVTFDDTVHGCFSSHHSRGAHGSEGSSHRRLQKSDEIKAGGFQ